MKIIPVLDIRNNLVVHAVGGNRQNYSAIESEICTSAMPFDVIDGFLDIYKFKSIYIADLDALENRGNHIDLLNNICERYPKISFWVDCGLHSFENYLQNIQFKNLRFILSSESISSLSTLKSMMSNHPDINFILSLDFKADQLIGSKNLLSAFEYWPDDVIVLNLSEVGEKRGFIYPTFIEQNNLINKFKIYVGGGIRDINDILNLGEQGVTGVLVSSCLHSLAITGNEIQKVSQ